MTQHSYAWKDIFEAKTPKFELTSIEQYAFADMTYRQYMNEFCEQIPSFERPGSIHGVDSKLFEKHSLFQKFQLELKTKYPNKFKGFTPDAITPMEDRIIGSLHLKMKLGEVVMELVKLAADRVELLHPGLGTHCLAMSLQFGGLTKVGNSIKEEGTRQYTPF